MASRQFEKQKEQHQPCGDMGAHDFLGNCEKFREAEVSWQRAEKDVLGTVQYDHFIIKEGSSRTVL